MSTNSYYAKLSIKEYYLQLCEELGVDPFRPREVAKGAKPARKASKRTSRSKRTAQVVALPKA